VIGLVYETHSLTLDNERGFATGWLPGELSPRGREGARELGERRRDDGIAAVFTSDLRRAVETVEIAFEGSVMPIHQDARLRECDYGELNGAPVAEVEAIRAYCIERPFPGGESYTDVVSRTRVFLDDLLPEHDGERILVVAHAANRFAFDHLLAGEPLARLVEQPFDWRPGWEYRTLYDSSVDHGPPEA
jgi:broad specificity phosphatase PhoE